MALHCLRLRGPDGSVAVSRVFGENQAGEGSALSHQRCNVSPREHECWDEEKSIAKAVITPCVP
uniref:Uncharacterized protein n=1 Tax=Setaria viridis TaxID=4556 RepID=A0A4U6VVL9_SETVI|nr:hypothetical protein SEVIR_2G212540v2 [Setaria viridis]